MSTFLHGAYSEMIFFRFFDKKKGTILNKPTKDLINLFGGKRDALRSALKFLSLSKKKKTNFKMSPSLENTFM